MSMVGGLEMLCDEHPLRGPKAAEGVSDAALAGEGLESVLLAALRRVAPCPVLDDQTVFADPQHGVDEDAVHAARLGDGERLLRVWRNPRCIVASRRYAGLPAFALARAASEAAAWPVAVRRSGGTAVVHRPGVLNVSLLSAHPRVTDHAVESGYTDLLDILRAMLARLGVICDAGEVPDAHCDGRYNLRWRGRKLAGTAGTISHAGGRKLRIFHASLMVIGAVEEDLAAINRFENAVGEPKAYDPSAHVSVAQILDRLAPANEL